jgi:hypothetical protein
VQLFSNMNAQNRYLASVALLVALAVVPSLGLSQRQAVIGLKCNGGACNDIRWTHDTVSMYATNIGRGRVRVQFNKVDVVLKPGESRGGFGLTIVGKPTAEYDGPRPHFTVLPPDQAPFPHN